MSSAFDMDEQGEGSLPHLRPLFTLLKDDQINDDDCVKKWVLRAKDLALEAARGRNSDIRENIKLYSGISHRNTLTTGLGLGKSNMTIGNSYGRSATSFGNSKVSPGGDTAPVVVNQLYSLTENRVSRIMRYKPTISVLPASGDSVSDRQAAKSVKDLTDYLYYVNDFDNLMRSLARRKYVAGEAYMFVEWDEDKGTVHPESSPEDGVKIGDLSFRIPLSQNVLLQPNRNGDFTRCDWLIERDYKDEDELKAQFPDKTDAIKRSSRSGGGNDNEDGTDATERLENEVEVFTLWHRHCKYLPEGRHIVFTSDGVLKNDILPYKHGKFPCLRITDIDIDGELYGMPIFSICKQLANLMNNCTSMMYRNIAKLAHAKWLIHRDAGVKSESLQNDISRMDWEGQHEPRLAVYQSTPADLMQFEQSMAEKLQQVFGVFGVSRGEPPPGIKAGIALQFLNEQENELMNSDVQKQNAFTKKIWLLALEVASQFYDVSDERVMQIFGKQNQYKIHLFDPTKLSTPVDIRVQDSSALPDSKAAKTQYLLDIKKEAPTAMDDKTFLEHLDMGTPESMITEATKAKLSADIENQSMFEGTPVLPPESFEDLLTHWQVHFTAMQGCEFKHSPDEIKMLVIDHVRATEMLILDKAFFNGQIGMVKNPAMAQALTMIPNFPAVFSVAEPVLPPAAPPPLPGDMGTAPSPDSLPAGIPAPPVVPEPAPLVEGSMEPMPQ